MRNLTTRLALVAIAAAAVATTAGTATAAPCIPSWTGYGPKVTVRPDLSHPTQSDVDYDSSAFSIQFDLCVI